MKIWQIVGGVALAGGVIYMQGMQKDEHADKILHELYQECGGSAGCTAALDKFGKLCVGDNLISHRHGKYSRDHTLDEEGFTDCMVSHMGQSYQVLAQADDEEEAVTADAKAAPDTAGTATHVVTVSDDAAQNHVTAATAVPKT